MTARFCLAGDPALLVLGRPSTLAHGRNEGRDRRFIKLGSRVAYRGSDLNAWLDDSTIRPADGQQGRDLPMRPVGHHHAAGRERPRAGHREVACLFASSMSRRVPRARQQRCVRAAGWAISGRVPRRSTLPLGRFQPLLLPADSVAARTNAGPARPPPRRAERFHVVARFVPATWPLPRTDTGKAFLRLRLRHRPGRTRPRRARSLHPPTAARRAVRGGSPAASALTGCAGTSTRTRPAKCRPATACWSSSRRT